MTNIIKFPKKKKVTYTNKTDVTGLKRRHDRDFGNGSWEDLEKGVFERHPQFAPGGAYYREENPPCRKWFGLFLFLLIVLPTFCQANGQLYPPGFITCGDCVTLRTPSLNGGNSTLVGHECDQRDCRATSRGRVQITVSGVHQPRYIFNDTDSINARKQRQFNTVKIADSWATYGVNR